MPVPVPVPVPPPPPTADGRFVTNFQVQNTGTTRIPEETVTFGQVFSPGDVPTAASVIGKLADNRTTIPLQMDVKASHPDGSVRHAVISTVVPAVAAGQSTTIGLFAIPTTPPPVVASPTTLLGAGFSAAVHADLNGQRYSASADELLRTTTYKTWLSGPIAGEWHVSAPLKTAQGVVHPHLSARFAIRAYGASKARVDVTVENAWAYEAAPQNFLYDAQVMVGGQSVYTKPALNHLHHARWRKVFWWGGEPSVHVKHNTAYLIATRAVPNFDQSVSFTESKLNAWKTQFSGAKSEPMAVGLAVAYMPTTGGRDDIGLLPGWAATYLLTMDKRVKDVTLGTADLSGSWSSHYRDRNTDRPVSVFDYPYMTILGRSTDTRNPVTKLYEAFPVCATTTACNSPNTHDSSHQPAFSYLPYLVTGDYYHLEELQFWAMWNTFSSNPGYREFKKGLLKSDQVRGQAWSMRTLAEAAYISPDTDPLKAQFTYFLNANLDWYDANYTNANDNNFGILTHGYAVAYDNWTGAAPWMDDFFTSAIGHVAELGYTKALPLLRWKAKFPIARMIDKDFCWIKGGIYALKIRDTQTSAFYPTLGQAYKASNTAEFNALACNSQAMATSLGMRVGEMTGYSSSHTGFPSNMQPALAYAADVGGTNGTAAWSRFMGRSVKPDYGMGPQFAIVPR